MTLDARKISKCYQGKIQALSEISLCFEHGVYGLLGPNGAGKSTLLNILTGNLKQDTGNIYYEDKDILKYPKEYKSILGYVPQNQGIYEEFTANRFLWYMAALKGMDKKSAKEDIPRVLEVVGLLEQANRKLGGFSGGMRQRVLIAQALLFDPKVLILDEPTAGLDPKERIHIRNFISKVAADRIVILATHVVPDISSIAKEVILMKKGTILKKGTPLEICADLDGRVWQCRVEQNQVEEIANNYVISNLQEVTGARVEIRFVTEDKKRPIIKGIEKSLVLVDANLDDAYLSLFEKSNNKKLQGE